MIECPEYTLTLPPPCSTNRDHLTVPLETWGGSPRGSVTMQEPVVRSGQVQDDGRVVTRTVLTSSLSSADPS